MNRNNFLPFFCKSNNLLKPHIPDAREIFLHTTDRDEFPYTRSYKGRFLNEEPTIHLRKAGYRPRTDHLQMEIPLVNTYDIYPKHQFQGTGGPCHHCHRSQADMQYIPIVHQP
jgi:hypothetical protein